MTKQNYNTIFIMGEDIFGQIYIYVDVLPQTQEQILNIKDGSLMYGRIDKKHIKKIERLMQNRRTLSSSLTHTELNFIDRPYYKDRYNINDIVG